MKNTRRTKVFAWIMSALLVVSLTPTMAFAVDTAEDTFSITLNPDSIIGTNDDEPIYFYKADSSSYNWVEFSNFEDEETVMVAAFVGYVGAYDGKNYARINRDYIIPDTYFDNEDIELISNYQEYKFSNCYGYRIMDEDYNMYYIVIQLPDQKEESLPNISFEASINNALLTNIKSIENGYKYIDFTGKAAESALKVITIPYGTKTIDFEFSKKCLAYNYIGKGKNTIVTDGTGDVYLDGAIDDPTIGTNHYTTSIDCKNRGYLDTIQIQTLYNDDNSGGWLLYGIALRYETFNAFIDNQALSKITVTEGGYIPKDLYTNKPADPVPLYTVTVPEDATAVVLEFDDPSLAYNYNYLDASYAAGGYSDEEMSTGVSEQAVQIDSNNDGKIDVIQVQTPFDENYNSQVLYGITFEGADLNYEPPEEAIPSEILHNIAKKYANLGTAGDQNAPWLTVDMMAYENAFPNSTNKLSSEQRQDMVDEAIDRIENSNSISVLSKYIICLTSMGYDPSKLTNSVGESLDGVKKLTNLTFDKNGGVTEEAKSAWTLPWVLVAYQQFPNTEEKQEKLVETALETRSAWLDTLYGVDSITFMIPALAPYYETNESVRQAIGEGKETVQKNQGENGSLGSAASDGLAIVALTSIKENVTEPLNGLMGYVSFSSDGFDPTDTSFATEQGFRGLIAASQNASWQSYLLYDFSGQELVPANSSKWNVKIKVSPEDATVSLTNSENNTEEQISKGSNAYLLEPGEYSYTVSRAGYIAKTGTITVTEGQKTTQNVILIKESSSSDTVNVTVQVLAHDGKTCDNAVTYKNDPDKYFSLLKKDGEEADSITVKLEKDKGTAWDALMEALDESDLTYDASKGYVSAIGDYEELSHGSNSGWMYLVNGKTVMTGAQDTTFSKNSTLTWYFTDDWSKDYGSEDWNDDPDDPSGDPDDPDQKGYYDDTIGHWAEDAINKVTDRGWMNGVADRKFAPDTTLSRAMFVTMLYRLEDSPSQSAAQTALSEGGSQEAASKFSDVEKDSWYEEAVAWAVASDIVKGTSETTFSPNANVTREQMAAFLSRYTESKDSPSQSAAQTALPNEESQGGLDRYLDKDQISDWALESMSWAVGQGLINGVTENQLQPKGTATRAQAATILIRFDERILQSN